MNTVITSQIFLIGINNFFLLNKDAIIIAVISSVFTCIVCLIFYKKQKKESKKDKKEFLVAINLRSNEYQESVELISDLKKEYNILNNQINNLIENKDYTEIQSVVKKYISIANKIVNKTEISELKNIENFTIKDIRSLHKKIFPKNYPIAGKLRDRNILIAGAENYIPPQSENVYCLLNNLLKEWNSKFKSLIKSTEKNKIKKIVKFHHKLLSIHPFLDGNGRLARIIMTKQIEKIFNRRLEIDLNREEYFKALRDADKNDFNKLELIIKRSLY